MCNKVCFDFGEAHLTENEVRGKKVLEVGARDVNGSLRSIAERNEPAAYVGVDLEIGPGVDEVCNVYELTEHFGTESFDVLICTEMIEHVLYWQKAISQMKRILKPGGILLITTRSKGFPYHDYPFDYWRFELSDMEAIFSDMKIESLEPDKSMPGVLVAARKPADFKENDMSRHALYSMVKAGTTTETEYSQADIFKLKLRNSFFPRKIRAVLQRFSS